MTGDDNVVSLPSERDQSKAATRKAADERERQRVRAWISDNLLSRADVRKIPPPRFIIEGWLVSDTLAQVYGPPGVGKSAVVLDMALCVATGRRWNGHATTRGGVVYLAGEGLSGLDARITAWEAEHNRGRMVEDFRVFRETLTLVSSKETDDLRDVVALLQPQLIVVDTQSRYTSGLDENSTKDMAPVIDFLTKWAVAAGACVLLVHHNTRGTDHARGSTAVEGALETGIYLSRDKSGKKPGRIRLAKQKNAADGTEVTFQLDEAHGSIVVRTGDAVVVPVTGPDPFTAPAALVTRRSPMHARLAWVLWSTWRGTSGATRTEMRSALQADDELRFPTDARQLSKAFSRAFTRLERDDMLDSLGNGRFVLSDAGIEQLGFTLELLDYVESQATDSGGDEA